MRKLLEKFCNDNERKNGLLLIDMPTGLGKTYSVAEYIAANYQNIKGKIFFVTQLKKNLPENDLRACFKKINKENELEEMLLRVENNVESLCSNFASVKEELYKYIGDKPLLWKIEREINIISRKDLSEDDLFLVQQAREDLQEQSERLLRNKITLYLSFDKDGKERKKQERIKLIKEDEAYMWIGKLYPTVYTNDKKIIIMSLDKFLLRYSTIIEPSFSIADSPLIKDGVVFIDEFDSTKDVILNRIIQDSLDNHLGIIELFRSIFARLLSKTEFTKILTEESQRIKENANLKSPETIIAGFKERVDEITKQYNLKFFHKIREESRENISFLFHDYKVHTVVNGKNKSILVDMDQDVRVNWLKVDEFAKMEEKDDSIYSLVNDLNSFLKYFQVGIGFIADNYVALKYERKKDIYNISYESAIRTVLSEFGLEGRNQNYITANVMLSSKRKSFDWQHAEDFLDFTVYEKGFRYYNLIDSDFYDTQSRLDYVAFNDSPEKFLMRLMNRTKVVGISATATLPSVLANFDIAYLKKRCSDLIVEPDNEDKKRLTDFYESATANYSEVEIKCKALGQEDALSNLAKNIFSDYSGKLEKGKDYIRKRFLCFAESVDIFFQQDDIKSFLFFANTKGTEYQIEGENLYRSLFDELKRRTGKSAKLYFLTGAIDVFEKRKQSLLRDLQNGEKVFVITTYGSMGAGQNIHYKYSDDFNDELVQINDFTYNLEEKDFDAIYLELPSNVIVNVANGFESDQAFVKYIYQMKFLQEAGDLEAWDVERRVRNSFRNRSGNCSFTDGHPKDSQHYFLAYAKIALQAIGRICRTPNKNKNVYILYQEEFADRIRPIANYFDNRMINPEFRKFLESCCGNSAKEELYDELIKYKIQAENNMIQGQQIINNLKANWTLNNVKSWEEIRELVLTKPTISSHNDTKFPDLYMRLPKPGNNYYFHENEHNKIEISFDKHFDYNCVDENSVMLPKVLKIPGVYDFFVSSGYATSFEKNNFMLTHNVLKQIYQGALGEIVGRHIIKTKLLHGMDLDFEDLSIDTYEKFDNKIGKIYFDFKLWSGNRDPQYVNEIKNIRRKMKKTDARQVIIINVLKPQFSVKPYLDSIQDVLLVLPYLYDLEKNEWNNEGLQALYKVLINKS